MAKNTLRKDTFRLIKTTMGRFLSLILIVTLGMAFFLGVSASSRIMDHSVDVYGDDTNLKDITVYSNFGFDEADVEAVKKLPDVAEAEGAKFVDVLASSEGTSEVARIHSYNPNGKINRFVLREGRLPQNEHEVLTEGGTGLEPGLPIGSVVHFSRPENDLEDLLDVNEATVVGWVDTPLYLNLTKENSTLSNQYIRTYFYIPESAFSMDYDLEINVLTKNGKSMDAFSDAYETYTKSVKQEIETLSKTQQSVRRDRIYQEAMDEYEDGLKDYLDGVDEYNTKIADAEKEIADGEKEIRDGEKELADAIVKLKDAEKELADNRLSGQTQIDQNRQALKNARVQLETGRQELEAEKVQYAPMIEQIDQALAQLKPSREQLSQFSLRSMPMAQFLMLLPEASTPTNPISQPLINGLMSALGIQPTQTVGEFLDAYILAYDDPNGTFITSSGMDPMVLAAVRMWVDLVNDHPLELVTIAQASMMQPELKELAEQLGVDEEQTLKELLDALDAKISELEQSKSQILTGFSDAEAQLADADQKIGAGEEQLYKAEQQMNAKLVDAQVEILDGWDEVHANQKKIADAKVDLEDGKKELADKRIDGQNELDEAKADLDKAKQDIDAIEDGEWTVLDRTMHYASRTYRDTIQQMKAIAAIFPVFFFMVASLVCLTTMTRMVDEQRGQLGIMRALGYTRLQCASKYLIYAGTATLIGSIFGTILGLLTFPAIIYNAWSMMYIHPKMLLYVPWDLVLLSCAGFFVVMLFTTWSACAKDMKEVPAQLMRPKAPKLGKSTLLEKIPLIWNHLSFTWKVTMRNLIRYKKRLFMTIVGVAGCTALLITGFGIKDSVNSMITIQFEEIQLYKGSVGFKSDVPVSKIQTFAEELKKRDDVRDDFVIGQYSAKAYDTKRTKDETVYTQVYPDASYTEQLYDLRTMKGKEPLKLTDDGAVIDIKLAENLNLSVGDTMILESDSGVEKEIRIAAIYENYIQHYILMTEDYYKSVYGVSKKTNAILVQGDGAVDELQKYLSNCEDVSAIYFHDEVVSNFSQMVSSLNLIVWVLIICSMSLAFVVLGNLTNINISERQREIATLKVLGFRRKEIESYIYKENNVLTFLGALFGIPVGIMLHHFIMMQVEMDYIVFGRTILPRNFVISVALTVLFGILVNLSMARKLHRIKMVESLKSVE